MTTDTRVATHTERTSLGPLSEDHAPMVVVRQVPGYPAERAEVERIEHVVTLPSAYQFPMGAVKTKRRKRGDRWEDVLDPQTGRPEIDDTRKVGITSDGYLFLNRTLGYDLYLPQTVIGRDGVEHNNPIHESEYLAIRGGVVYRSDFGQLLYAEETIEVDFWQTYQDARLNQFSAEVVMKDGVPTLVDGWPLIRLSADDERSAARVLSALRSSGLKRAQTTLFTRLLKVAIGIKSLPIKSPMNINIKLVTFRDQLSPSERIEKAMRSSASVYGGVGMKVQRLEPDEVADLAGGDADDSDASFLGREESERSERSHAEVRNVTPPLAGAYSPDAEQRAAVDPSTIPGVSRGMPTPERPRVAVQTEAERQYAAEADANGGEPAPAPSAAVPVWDPREMEELDKEMGG